MKMRKYAKLKLILESDDAGETWYPTAIMSLQQKNMPQLAYKLEKDDESVEKIKHSVFKVVNGHE